MKRHLASTAAAAVVGSLILWGGQGLGQVSDPPPAPQPVARTLEEATQPAPAVAAEPMSLQMCVDLGLQGQPAIDAAQASLNAAMRYG